MKGRGVTEVVMCLLKWGGEDTALRGVRVQRDWKFSVADFDLEMRDGVGDGVRDLGVNPSILRHLLISLKVHERGRAGARNREVINK